MLGRGETRGWKSCISIGSFGNLGLHHSNFLMGVSCDSFNEVNMLCHEEQAYDGPPLEGCLQNTSSGFEPAIR